jgi:hypothetical protein
MTFGLLLLAHVFDYGTFLWMTSRHGLSAEANPIVVMMATDFGLPGLTLAKIASVLFLAGVTVLLYRSSHLRTARLLVAIGVIAGVLGGFSNVASF